MQQLLDQLERIRVWKSGGNRAPNKPLLLLIVASMYQRDSQRLIRFIDIERKLSELLSEFGTPRTASNPHYPFWYLYSDQIWDLEGIEVPDDGVGKHTPSVRRLRSPAVRGGLKQVYFEALQDSASLRTFVSVLLEEHFEPDLHQDILDAVGWSDRLVLKTIRDPEFRNRILRAYEGTCAVCGFGARVKNTLAAVEAAHIKWHSHGGPDVEPNGIALCSLHHKLFDRGAFTIDKDRVILVSEASSGTAMFGHLMLDFHGRRLREPIRSAYEPKIEFVDWHTRQVFWQPARERRAV